MKSILKKFLSKLRAGRNLHKTEQKIIRPISTNPIEKMSDRWFVHVMSSHGLFYLYVKKMPLDPRLSFCIYLPKAGT